MRKIDRTGEININCQGIQMKIVEYNNSKDFIVQFDDEINSTRHCYDYKTFQKRGVKSLYYKDIYEKGYIGEGKYDSKSTFLNRNIYKYWSAMMRRVYNDKRDKFTTPYEQVNICEEWCNFQKHLLVSRYHW